MDSASSYRAAVQTLQWEREGQKKHNSLFVQLKHKEERGDNASPPHQRTHVRLPVPPWPSVSPAESDETRSRGPTLPRHPPSTHTHATVAVFPHHSAPPAQRLSETPDWHLCERLWKAASLWLCTSSVCADVRHLVPRCVSHRPWSNDDVRCASAHSGEAEEEKRR